jgi:tight adherence protein C
MDMAIFLPVFLVLLAIILIGYWVLFIDQSGSHKKRIRSLERRKEELYEIKNTRLKDKPNLVEQETVYTSAWVQKILGKSGFIEDERLSKYRATLAKAGIRDHKAVWKVVAFKLMLLVCIPVVSIVLITMFNITENTALRLLIVVGSGAIGYILPDILLANTAEKRMLNITKFFPDAIDMLVVCSEAGLSFNAALKRVSSEMSKSSPDLADELAVTLVELNFLEKRSNALENMARRIDIPQARSFANMLIQTEKFGTPIGQSLRVLSDDFRKDRMNAAEVKAGKLSTKMTLPMMLFIFLPLFVVILFPGIYKALNQ